MARTRFSRLMLTLAGVAAVSLGHAQTVQRSPTQELSAARQALDAIPAALLTGEAARRVDEIRRDLEDLTNTYAAQSRPPAGNADTGGGLGGSWRLKLGILNSDLRAASDLAQPVVVQLSEVRARLDAFYAAAIGTGSVATTGGSGASSAGTSATAIPPAPAAGPAPTMQPPAPGAQTAGSSALGLLDRVQTLVDGLLTRDPNESDSLERAGRVTVDRATLVEIQSAIGQLRAMAQTGGAVRPR